MLERNELSRLHKRLNRMMKDFLFSERSREFFLFLFFFFVAGGFWLLQTLNGEFEDDLEMPFRLKGLPADVVITSDLPQNLQLRVKDRGTVLLNYKVGKDFLPLSIDFDKVKGNDNRVRIPASQLEKQLLSQMNASTRLLSVKPDTLDFYYTRAKSKRVPVRINGKVTAAQTYFLADTLYTPDSVEVYAPAQMLDTIVAAYTTYTEWSEVADTVKRTLELNTQKGVKFIPQQVEVNLFTDVYTEASLELPLEGIGFPSGKELRAFPSKVKVMFQVGKNRYKTLRADEFQLKVPYDELMQLKEQKYSVTLQQVPQGVLNVRFIPEQVDFLIEQVNTYSFN
ncbi:MAG: CdaR family protein [Bacteroides sp.]